MSINNSKEKPFSFRFVDAKPRILLELKNTTETTLASIEILSIFLKSVETPDGRSTQAQIKFETLKSMHPHDTSVIPHRTWIDGRPVNDERDQMERLKIVDGQFTPYVLEISWQNTEGKSRFQRIPVGH